MITLRVKGRVSGGVDRREGRWRPFKAGRWRRVVTAPTLGTPSACIAPHGQYAAASICPCYEATLHTSTLHQYAAFGSMSCGLHGLNIFIIFIFEKKVKSASAIGVATGESRRRRYASFRPIELVRRSSGRRDRRCSNSVPMIKTYIIFEKSNCVKFD